MAHAAANDASAEDRLRALGLELPPPKPPVGAYVPAVREGGLLYLSGHGPDSPGRTFRGQVGVDVSMEDAQTAVVAATLNLLSAIRQEIGSLDRVRRIVKLLGMVNSPPEFTEHPRVLNAASDLLVAIFGERGRHARSAVGMSSLPNNIPVEIEMIVAVDSGTTPGAET